MAVWGKSVQAESTVNAQGMPSVFEEQRGSQRDQRESQKMSQRDWEPWVAHSTGLVGHCQRFDFGEAIGGGVTGSTYILIRSF